MVEWRRQFWSYLDASPDAPTTWPDKTKMPEDFKVKVHDILLDANEGVQAVIEEFGG